MKSVVILGASTDRNKFGNKAVRAFQRAGWQVYPVNPAGGEVEGLPVFATLAEVPQPLDLVSIYLPPRIALGVLPEIKAAQAAQVFFNPGADTPDVIAAAKALGIDPVRTCSIVWLGLSPSMFPGG